MEAPEHYQSTKDDVLTPQPARKQMTVTRPLDFPCTVASGGGWGPTVAESKRHGGNNKAHLCTKEQATCRGGAV